MRTNERTFNAHATHTVPAKLQQAQLCAPKPAAEVVKDGFQAAGSQAAVQWPSSPRSRQTRLIAAAQEGNTTEVQRILEEALMHPRRAKQLLREAPNRIGVLEAAAKEGQEDVVELLLEYWLKNPTLRHEIIKRPGEALALAAEKGQLKIVSMMLERIRDFPELKTFMCRDVGTSPLQIAVEGRHHEIASLFIKFAEENPSLVDWVFDGVHNSLRDAVVNFDDEMIRIMMTTKNWRRFADAVSDKHAKNKERIEEAIRPYVVDL